MRPSRRPALKLDQETSVVRREFLWRCRMFVRVAMRQTPADVAELVDALVSGTSGSNVVGVQVSPSALSCWSQAPTTDHDCFEDLQLIGGGGFQGRKVS